jgi:hypothetical protein
MARLIEVLVSPAGETRMQTRGYAGTACLAASAWLEQALGDVTAEQKTPEFYAAALAAQQQETQT